MGDRSAIQWTNATWNPTVGCSIVSPGCRLCYAMDEAARQILCAAGSGRETHYAGTVEKVKGRNVWTGKVNIAPDHIWERPLHWRRPRMIFVNSMSDLFHEDIPDDVIDRAFGVMALCPQHIFQVLTKRDERMRRYFAGIPGMEDCPEARGAMIEGAAQALYAKLHPDEDPDAIGMTLAVHTPLPNVCLGVSAERQREADERIPNLLATPAAVRFVSLEPLLGPMAVRRYLEEWSEQVDDLTVRWNRGLDWVIAGGESARTKDQQPKPMHPDWVRSLRDQCAAAGVPFFFKQWGDWAPSRDVIDLGSYEAVAVLPDGAVREWQPDYPQARLTSLHMASMRRVGVEKAGRLLDGREHNEFPLPRGAA